MPIKTNQKNSVSSVNNKTGDVVLNASDVGALPIDTKIPTKTSELENDTLVAKEEGKSLIADNEIERLAAVTNYDDTEVKESIEELSSNLAASNAGAHNCVYRGKYLGNALTTEQKAQISAGTFNDLYIGDYWTIGGVNYRIAAFDYWLNSGDIQCTEHHIVVIPDTCLYTANMNDTNITTGAYVGSKMYTENLNEAKTTIRNAFGTANILTHRELLTNTISENRATDLSWYDSDIELMNESMVYGSPVGSKAVDNSINFNVGIDKSQLALFRLDPSRICNRAHWWLRCVVSSTYFALVSNFGGAIHTDASSVFGVRPAFGIKG